jgi:hypothetical protein
MKFAKRESMKLNVLPIAAAVVLATFAVQGCSLPSSTSSVESSALPVNQSASTVFAAFDEGEDMTADIGSIASSDNIAITKDDGKSITYSIASSIDAGGSTITFYFDEAGENKSIIRAEIDVPPVKRGTKFLSEHKIRNEIDKSLKEFAAALNDDKSPASALRQINSTLLIVDIVTNSTNDEDDMQLVMDMMEAEGGEASLASADYSEGNVSNTAITGKPSIDLEEDTLDSDESDGNADAGDEW